MDKVVISKDEWEQVVALIGSAPLKNMIHAQQVDALLQKVIQHAGLLPPPPTPPKRKRKAAPTASFKEG